MEIPTQDELIARIEAFCRKHEMAETRFGRDAVNNPAFLRQLRDGKSPTLETLNKVSAFMERTAADAATQAKLSAPIEPPGSHEAEIELPFASAPVNLTGASSPTSSPTSARPPHAAANGTCHCSAADGQAAAPNPSCSEADA